VRIVHGTKKTRPDCINRKKSVISAEFTQNRVDFDSIFTPLSPFSILSCGVLLRGAQPFASGEDRRKKQENGYISDRKPQRRTPSPDCFT
jgi:hypothetical protein